MLLRFGGCRLRGHGFVALIGLAGSADQGHVHVGGYVAPHEAVSGLALPVREIPVQHSPPVVYSRVLKDLRGVCQVKFNVIPG